MSSEYSRDVSSPPADATGRVAPVSGDVSSPAGSVACRSRSDSSPGARAGRDASRQDLCEWCDDPIPEVSPTGRRRRRDSKFCSKRCRQASNRFRVGRAEGVALDGPMRFAYADPPYPGKAHLYPEGEEVNHAALLTRLVREFPDGWALSTSSEALRFVLALCPDDVRVGAWLRPVRHTRSRRPLQAWEPVVIRGGRPLPTDQPQVVEDAIVARGRHHAYPGALVGMKPPAFSEWMFRQLGALAGDEFVDLYPGSGAVTRAWERYVAPDVGGDASALQERRVA